MSTPRDPSSAKACNTLTLARRLMIGAALLTLASATAHAEDDALPAKAARLIAAYPEHLDRLDGNMLVWKDGERMPFDDGLRGKTPEALLESPDIEDQFAYVYPLADEGLTPPPENADPGRIRNNAFFFKMYGDCKKGGLKGKLATIDWLPKKKGGRMQVTTVNGVHEKLKAVSDELDALPDKFNEFLTPSAGAYVCRAIAATERRSAHGFGFAVDINASRSDYWLWRKSGAKGAIGYRNKIPVEIVRIFEKHGFIWGGRWYHFDTMHFEYRPELFGTPRVP